MPTPSTTASVGHKPAAQTDDFLKIQDLVYLCLSKWKWFVCSLLLTLGGAAFYLLKTPPVYTRSAQIQIKDQSNTTSFSDAVSGDFSGLFKSNTNVYNELLSFRSPSSMYEVAKRLHLEMNYTTDGAFYRKVLYGSTLPYLLQFIDLEDQETVSLQLRPKEEGGFAMTHVVYNGTPVRETFSLQLNDTLTTPMGKVLLTPGEGAGALKPSDIIYVDRTTVSAAAAGVLSRYTAQLTDKQTTVVQLSIQDLNTQRAEDVLNMIVSVYKENWVKDKNQIAVSTSIFINERLEIIEQELGSVEQDISSYKSEHLLPDVQAASGMYMSQSNQMAQEIFTLKTQQALVNYVRNYLMDGMNGYQLLPANSGGLDGSGIEGRIAEYNTLVLQRNRLVASSSEKNPLVKDLDGNLAMLRTSILASIENYKSTLQVRIKALEQQEERTNARLAASPAQAKYLLSIERQQKVKESLYLFLLQKREENELSQAFTAYNTRLITPPSGSMQPTSPVKYKIYLMALALGLLIPVGILYLQESMNTTVRGRKDLQALTLPYVGEIPLAYRKKRTLLPWKKQKEEQAIVVKDKSRNVINEAFRVVRTNLEFMLGQEPGSKTIMISSINPGSGKTFICMNLSTSLAIKDKKVLALDLDLRRATLSTFVQSPKQGIADFLAGRINDFKEVIVRGQTHPNLDVLPVGTIPPNPTELLFSERIQPMLEQLRKEYDYIFIDCPPVEIVADASIINKWVDLTLFIVRSEMLDRSMLPQIESFYTEHKYRNLSLLLNGTQEAYNRYGYHKYGYRYGYHYGYGSYSKHDN